MVILHDGGNLHRPPPPHPPPPSHIYIYSGSGFAGSCGGSGSADWRFWEKIQGEKSNRERGSKSSKNGVFGVIRPVGWAVLALMMVSVLGFNIVLGVGL